MRPGRDLRCLRLVKDNLVVQIHLKTDRLSSHWEEAVIRSGILRAIPGPRPVEHSVLTFDIEHIGLINLYNIMHNTLFLYLTEPAVVEGIDDILILFMLILLLEGTPVLLCNVQGAL